jgi:Fe2+ or Zn2+ uptake regulation protein
MYGTMTQNPWGMGYVAIYALKWIKDGYTYRDDKPFFIDSGFDLLTKDNLQSYQKDMEEEARAYVLTMKDETANIEHIYKQLAEFEALCKATGLKITPQRVEIYKALVSTTEHPSAEMLWRKVKSVFPNISLDTVNRTLLTLNEIGAAFIVEGSGDVKRFDGGTKCHQHLRCVKCRKIVCLITN